MNHQSVQVSIPLEPGVNLRIRVLRREISIPLVTIVRESRLIGSRQLVPQRGDPLEEVDAETARDVPRDVAVHQPGARVVRPEGDEQPALGGQHGDVAAGRVVAVEEGEVGGRVELVPRLGKSRGGDGRAAEDEEVVPVQVEGVREGELGVDVVLDEPVGPLAVGGDGDDVFGAWVGGVALDDVLHDGLVPVDVDGRAVDLPDEDGRAGRVEVHGEGVVGDGLKLPGVAVRGTTGTRLVLS